MVHKLVEKTHKKGGSDAGGGAVYGLGLVGALIYFLQSAVGFGGVILGILKAIVWPGYIVYKLLESFYG